MKKRLNTKTSANTKKCVILLSLTICLSFWSAARIQSFLLMMKTINSRRSMLKSIKKNKMIQRRKI